MKSPVALLTLAGLLFQPLLAETPSAAALLSPFVERGELAGAVALVSDAKGTLSVDCVGWADIEAKRPMTPDTLFWIASESKPMTAVAVFRNQILKGRKGG